MITSYFSSSEKKLLSDCSLVCHSWLPICRQRLFRKLNIRGGVHLIEDLIQFLSTTPHVLGYIKDLHIEGNRPSSNNDVPSFTLSSYDLIRILQPLKNLQNLRFSFVAFASLDNSSEKEIISSQKFKLKSVSFRDTKWERGPFNATKSRSSQGVHDNAQLFSAKEFLHTLQLFSDINHLEIECLYSLKLKEVLSEQEIEEAVSQNTEVPQLSIHELRIRIRILALPSVLNILTRIIEPGSLNAVNVSCYDPTSRLAFANLLRVNSSSIARVALNISDAELQHNNARSEYWDSLGLRQCTNLPSLKITLYWGSEANTPNKVFPFQDLVYVLTTQAPPSLTSLTLSFNIIIYEEPVYLRLLSLDWSQMDKLFSKKFTRLKKLTFKLKSSGTRSSEEIKPTFDEVVCSLTGMLPSLKGRLEFLSRHKKYSGIPAPSITFRGCKLIRAS
ncbi:hypothetical protein ABKN59_002236 [Abortiporus biennis]